MDEVELFRTLAGVVGTLWSFTRQHECRHVHQLLAYPGLYLRAIREHGWAWQMLIDFRNRGDLPYSPRGDTHLRLSGEHPEVDRLGHAYYSALKRYPMGVVRDGEIVWDDRLDRRPLAWRRWLSETKLLEGEALAVQFTTARGTGYHGTFRSWLTETRADATPISDVVTLLSEQFNQLAGHSYARAVDRDLLDDRVVGCFPVLVWHAFHTTWPVTAFFEFLRRFARPIVQGIGPAELFVILSVSRQDPRFAEHCPVVGPAEISSLLRSMPQEDPWCQFDDDASTWSAFTDMEADYPLAPAARQAHLDGKWPVPLDFAVPLPDLCEKLEASYPPFVYRITIGAGVFRQIAYRASWRTMPNDQAAAIAENIEMVLTLFANFYAHVVTPEEDREQRFIHTCPHTECPMHATGLSRFYDFLPAEWNDCRFLTMSPTVLAHEPDREAGVLRQIQGG